MPSPIDRYFGVHASALELRQQRMTLIASNIANAATPNYKARDIDFGAALSRAAPGGPLATTAPGHIAAPATPGAGALAYRVPLNPSADGNTVELVTEQAAFGENAVKYQSTLAFLNGRIGQILSALKGE